MRISKSFLTATSIFCATSSLAANRLEPKVQKHVDRARAAAGAEYGRIMPGLCPGQGPVANMAVNRDQRDSWYKAPAKVFDNLYYVGQSTVSAWAIKTSEGIILIDALFDYSVQPEIIEGLEKLGVDPSTIRYVIVTHGHFDHWGGAKLLKDRGARIIMGAADWTLMENGKGGKGEMPRRDIMVDKRQSLTLGDTTIDIVPTPGHTPATLSVIFPVKDGSKSHVAAIWGGTGLGARQDVQAFRNYADSSRMFMGVTREAKVDIPLSNHPIVDQTFAKIALLQARKPGAPNPFVRGLASQHNLLTLAAECADAQRLNRNVRIR